MKEVLDSRFFSVLLFEADEKLVAAARAKLVQVRREKRGIVPAVVVAEVMNLVCREAGRDRAWEHLRALEVSGLDLASLDPGVAAQAGMLQCSYRDLPLADAIVAAVAMENDGRVISDDPHFDLVRGLRVAWIA